MSMEHMDNYSMYGGNVAYMLNGVYAEVIGASAAADPDGVSPGWVMLMGAGAGVAASQHRGHRYVLNAANAKVGICGRIWLPALPTGANGTPCPLIFRDGANNPIATVTVDSTGRMALRLGDYNAAAFASTVNPVITANGWYHLEGWLDITANTFELRIEGVPVITAVALGLGAITVAQVFVGTRSTITSAVRTFYWKDFVVCNGSGAYNNTFVGSVIIYDLAPTADVALNWTLVGGPNGFSILDNAPPDDAIFLQAPNPPPAAYKASHGPLPPDVTSVKGIMTMVRAAKSDGGDANLQVGVISDPLGVPATVLGSNRPITIAQTYWRDVFETDPSTVAPWLPTAVDACHIQINRTA